MAAVKLVVILPVRSSAVDILWHRWGGLVGVGLKVVMQVLVLVAGNSAGNFPYLFRVVLVTAPAGSCLSHLFYLKTGFKHLLAGGFAEV